MKTNIIFAIAALLLITACSPGTIVIEQPDQETPPNTINVQGMTEFDVAPDEVELIVAIETRNTDVQAAQNDNRDRANKVGSALLSAGVLPNMIETQNYNVHRETRWNPDLRQEVVLGYVVTNTMKVKTTNLDAVGKIIDTAVGAGANNIRSISFQLSDRKEKEAKEEALRQAAASAQDKAKALASSLGVRLGGVRSVSESSFNVVPYARYDVMEAAVMKAGAEPTPISPQSVQVNAQVQVSYLIG